MTVLGIGNEKADDKEQLVGKEDVATIMPSRIRLVKLQRRRSLITLILSIGFLLIFLCGVFLTVCFIKKIGPFRRHYVGKCPVGSKRFNGHTKIFESFEITDKYALIHVPRFNFKHGTFDSIRTLHVFDKKITVIQHQSMCFVKPMMRYQMLGNDWFEKLHMLSNHHFRTPKRFAHYHLQIMRPQLPGNYLRDEVHHLADAMCSSRPVFRLEFQVHFNHHPRFPMCDMKCGDECPASDQVYTRKLVGNRRCRVCQCIPRATTPNSGQLHSSNRVDPNCKTIRCENKCGNKNHIGCVQCRCADGEVVNEHITASSVTKPGGHMAPMIVEAGINTNTDPSVFVDKQKHHPIFANNNDGKTTPDMQVFKERQQFQPIFDDDVLQRNKRSASVGKKECKVVAKIFEGYTPLEHEMRVPVDYIHDC